MTRTNYLPLTFISAAALAVTGYFGYGLYEDITDVQMNGGKHMQAVVDTLSFTPGQDLDSLIAHLEGSFVKSFDMPEESVQRRFEDVRVAAEFYSPTDMREHDNMQASIRSAAQSATDYYANNQIQYLPSILALLGAGTLAVSTVLLAGMAVMQNRKNSRNRSSQHPDFDRGV